MGCSCFEEVPQFLWLREHSVAEHKIIQRDYTGFTAADAEGIGSLDLGGIFYTQIKTLVFRIGNTYTQPQTFRVSASGTNTEMISAAEFSSNGREYDSYTIVSGVNTNQVSPPVFCRLNCPVGMTNGSGVFLIQVSSIQV